MTDVAVIGLGNMGGAVARRLNERFDLIGFDASPAALDRARADGLRVADSFGEAVEGAEFVFTSLPNSDIVRDAWLGADGVIEHANDGSVAIELSSITPMVMRDIAEAALVAGVRPVDSPVSGGPGEALTGKLSLLVGGDDDDVERASDVLGQIGTVRRTGGIGTGKIVKIVNNMMSMANVLAASEAFALGVAAGVDPQRLYDVLSVSGGTSQHFTKRWPKALAGDFEPGFTMALGEKDLALGVELARAMHMPSPVASTGREMYQLAMLDGLAEKDIVSLLTFYQRWGERGRGE